MTDSHDASLSREDESNTAIEFIASDEESNQSPSNETFTELDVDERRQLRDEVEAIKPGQWVRLTYDSNRSASDQTVEAAVESHDDVALYGYTDDLKGDIYVKIRDDLTRKHHAGLIVRTTGGRTTSRQPRLGELLSVEVIDNGN